MVPKNLGNTSEGNSGSEKSELGDARGDNKHTCLFAFARARSACFAACSFCASGLPFGHVDGLHPTFPHTKHFPVGAMDSCPAARPPLPLPQSFPRPPPRGNPEAADDSLSGGGLSGGFPPPPASSLRTLASPGNCLLAATILGGTSERPRF